MSGQRDVGEYRPVADRNQQQRFKLPENSQIEKDETDTDHQDPADTDRPVLVSLCFDHSIESGGLKKIYCQLEREGRAWSPPTFGVSMTMAEG